jgi:hypothetical protein
MSAKSLPLSSTCLKGMPTMSASPSLFQSMPALPTEMACG